MPYPPGFSATGSCDHTFLHPTSLHTLRLGTVSSTQHEPLQELLAASGLASLSLTPCDATPGFSGCCCLGSLRAICTKSSFTLLAVLALVSINIMLFSSAYCRASSGSTFRFDAKSDLLPASAITMLGFPCRCSSRTQLLARAKESGEVISYTTMAAAAPR